MKDYDDIFYHVEQNGKFLIGSQFSWMGLCIISKSFGDTKASKWI